MACAEHPSHWPADILAASADLVNISQQWCNWAPPTLPPGQPATVAAWSNDSHIIGCETGSTRRDCSETKAAEVWGEEDRQSGTMPVSPEVSLGLCVKDPALEASHPHIPPGPDKLFLNLGRETMDRDVITNSESGTRDEQAMVVVASESDTDPEIVVDDDSSEDEAKLMAVFEIS